MNDSNKNNNWAAWKKALLVLAIVVVVGIVALASYVSYRPLRAKQLARQAMVDLKEGDLTAARDHIRAASSIRPNDLEVARAMAYVWSQIAPSQVVSLWEHAAELSGNANEDVRGLITALIGAGELDQAKKKLDELVKVAAVDPETKYMQAVWSQSIANYKEAHRLAIQLIESNNEEIRFWLLYSSLAPSFDQEDMATLRERLSELGKRDDQLGLWALRECIRYAVDKDAFDSFSKRVRAHPLFSRKDLLFIEATALVRWKTPYEEIRNRVAPYFDPGKLEDRQKLGRFYRTIGDSYAILDLITPKQAINDKGSLLIYLDALAGAGKWNELLEILDLSKLPLEGHWREIFRARALASLGKEAEADLAWKRSLSEAGNNVSMLMDISEYLMAIGAVNEYELVMERLIDDATLLAKPNLYQMWIGFIAQTRDLNRLLNIYERALADFPENKSFQNDSIYYSLLLGKDGDWVIKAYNLAKGSPDVLSYRVTLALALLKSGQNKEALSVIDGAGLSSWTLVNSGWQVVRGAIYKANGKKVPSSAQNAKMMALPQEAALLD